MLDEIVKAYEKNIEELTGWAKYFVQLEILLFLAEKINDNYSPESLYLLLGSRNLIVKDGGFTEEDFWLSNAKQRLKTMNQAKVFRDTLNLYNSAEFENIRLYDVVEDKIIRRIPKPVQFENREEAYLEVLNTPLLSQKPRIKYAYPSEEKIYGFINKEKKPIKILFPNDIEDDEEVIYLNKKNEKIHLSKIELLETAKDLDNRLSHLSPPYRERIIRKNNILKVIDSEIGDAEFITIENITNLVGQVGAGKSVLAETISVALARKGYKVAIIQPTVMESLKYANTLNNIGISVANVIGSSSRMRHVKGAYGDKDYLDDYYSETLTSGCYVGALLEDPDEVIDYGDEPCYKLKKYVDGVLKESDNYVCPYFYKCPKTKMDKKVMQSNVIVTTIEGLCSTTISPRKDLVFNFILNTCDLVIIDEAESVLCKLDDIFAPTIGADKYIRINAEIQAEYSKAIITNKVTAVEREFVEELNDFAKGLVEIWERIRNETTGFPGYRLKRFTALQLLNYLNEDSENSIYTKLSHKRNDENSVQYVVESEKYLNKEIWTSIYKLLGNRLCYEQSQVLISAFSKDVSLEGNLIMLAKLNKNSEEAIEAIKNMELTMKKKLEFLIMLISFDHIYRRLSVLVKSNNQLPISAKSILNQTFAEQQKYMPVAPIGNILRFEVKKDDLDIAKQFATGRALALKFPWLKLDEKGNPLGPNVLLMSGTSFVPDSYMYHINCNVDYIIEAEEYKRAYIRKSIFTFTQDKIKISGIKEERKEEKLRELLKESKELIIKCLDKNENILMIVNKYEQCTMVSNYLNMILRKAGYDEVAIALQSDSDLSDNEQSIKRSKVSSFDGRILIAPAMALERAYNIVDESGNSRFDTLMFLVRPMNDPSDNKLHIKKVNGYIMTKYSEGSSKANIDTYKDIRTKAFQKYSQLTKNAYAISQLDEEIQKDITVTLFVTIMQIFGRLCRIGEEEVMKEAPIKVYFMDAAFKSKGTNSYNFLEELINYLDDIMSKEEYREIAKTLYEPFYTAIKKGEI